MMLRRCSRALAAAILAAGVSGPFLTHAAARADDTGDSVDSTVNDAANNYLSDYGFDPNAAVADFVPTDPNARACPAGLYPLLFQGEPVVSDANGTPVCVTSSAGGQVGDTIPGQPGQSGGDSNSEGVTQPGQLGEGQTAATPTNTAGSGDPGIDTSDVTSSDT
jgi:hypothetical protein